MTSTCTGRPMPRRSTPTCAIGSVVISSETVDLAAVFRPGRMPSTWPPRSASLTTRRYRCQPDQAELGCGVARLAEGSQQAGVRGRHGDVVVHEAAPWWAVDVDVF